MTSHDSIFKESLLSQFNQMQTYPCSLVDIDTKNLQSLENQETKFEWNFESSSDIDEVKYPPVDDKSSNSLSKYRNKPQKFASSSNMINHLLKYDSLKKPEIEQIECLSSGKIEVKSQSPQDSDG